MNEGSKSFVKHFVLNIALLCLTGVIALLLSACGGDDPASPPTTGKVLVASVAGDSVGISLGSATKSSNVSTTQIDFTDRDSVEITYFYTGNSNNTAIPFTISFTSSSSDSVIYSAAGLNLNSAEHQVTVTVPSPKVREYFFYKIRVTSTAGFGFFKFRDLMIYKK